VPSHFVTDSHGLGRFDGTALYEHADPRQGFHPDWNTYIFNYGRNEVRSFLLSNALFWLDKYHADGLRVDAVASMLYLDYSRPEGQWIPNRYGGRENLEAIAFLRQLNAQVYQHYPDTLTAAEESTSWPKVSRPVYDGGLGFGYKWDMGWMHDTLAYLAHDPVHRKYHHNQIGLRRIRELHLAAVARRSGAWQRFAAGQDARGRLAEVRQPAVALGISIRPAGKEASVHGL
jgi:1,4-alpha-glucan branching enzyme